MSNPIDHEKVIKEMLEEHPEDMKIEDKRRFDDSGERIEVSINDTPEEETKKEEPAKKSAEVVNLENALKEMTTRCEAAETKLQDVQKRFEAEREGLEKETSEMRSRLKKSLEQQADQGRFNFLTTLLPVLDNLNLALEAAGKDASVENLIGGVQGTARSFENALISVGVEPVESVGHKFNPEIHEAVDMIETDEENVGMITAEFARGYTFNGRLLRAARVQVGMKSANKGDAESA